MVICRGGFCAIVTWLLCSLGAYGALWILSCEIAFPMRSILIQNKLIYFLMTIAIKYLRIAKVSKIKNLSVLVVWDWNWNRYGILYGFYILPKTTGYQALNDKFALYFLILKNDEENAPNFLLIILAISLTSPFWADFPHIGRVSLLNASKV